MLVLGTHKLYCGLGNGSPLKLTFDVRHGELFSCNELMHTQYDSQTMLVLDTHKLYCGLGKRRRLKFCFEVRRGELLIIWRKISEKLYTKTCLKK